MAVQSGVEEYYDRNTRRFLRYGRGGEELAIHRELWGPGVTSRRQAIVYVNKLVLEQLSRHLGEGRENHIVDLGCGAGGTIFWLQQRLKGRYTGVTISRAQVELARQHAERHSLNNCTFVKADFTTLPDIGESDAAYAIESFLHAPDASRFFAGIAQVMKPGGLLVICDDFLDAALSGKKRRFWLDRFRKGWHAGNLVTAEEAITKGKDHGFRLVDKLDLSEYLRPYYSDIVLFLLKWLTLVPLSSPFWAALSGGTALQVCLKKRWIQYAMLVFEKE